MTFDNNGKPSRDLPFPYDWNEFPDASNEADGEITHVTPDFFPEDPEERIDILLNLSFNEFTTLASTIDIGRDIGYGEQSGLVWWTWIRALRGVPTLTCEEIIDCIENDPDVMLAVTNSLVNSGIVDPNTVDPDGTTVPMRFAGSEQDLEDLIGTLEDCDLDALWGALRSGIVLYLDDNARNFLEDLTASSDLAERASALVGAIPVIGDIASAITKQFVEIAPDLLNLFNAYSSESVLDEIACEIFELVCAECRFPTWDELFSYYASAGISGIDDVQELVLTAATDLLIGSTGLAALACYHTIITYELFVLYLQAKFQGAQGTGSIALWAGLGEDFGSDNWIELCDGCEPPATVEPEIGIEPCSGALGAAAGTNLVNTTGVTWTGASTARASDHALTIVRAGGGLFHVGNIVGLTGTISFYGWKLSGGSCAAGASPPSISNNFEMFMFTGPTAFTVQFSFEEA